MLGEKSGELGDRLGRRRGKNPGDSKVFCLGTGWKAMPPPRSETKEKPRQEEGRFCLGSNGEVLCANENRLWREDQVGDRDLKVINIHGRQ